jgi:hypothetical protein
MHTIHTPIHTLYIHYTYTIHTLYIHYILPLQVSSFMLLALLSLLLSTPVYFFWYCCVIRGLRALPLLPRLRDAKGSVLPAPELEQEKEQGVQVQGGGVGGTSIGGMAWSVQPENDQFCSTPTRRSTLLRYLSYVMYHNNRHNNTQLFTIIDTIIHHIHHILNIYIYI